MTYHSIVVPTNSFKGQNEKLNRNVQANHINKQRTISNSSDSEMSSTKQQEIVTPPIKGRSSKLNFLEKLKYFEEQKYPKHIDPRLPVKLRKPEEAHLDTSINIKNTISDIRSQFPKEYVDDSNSFNITPSVKRSSTGSRKSQSSAKQQEVTQVKTEASSESNFNNSIHPELSTISNNDDIQRTIAAAAKENSKNSDYERQKRKPVRNLSVRETIHNARAQFENEFLHIPSTPNSEYSGSSCEQFFTTGKDDFLLNEIPATKKQFKVLLSGNMYNKAYNFQEFAFQNKSYYLHDFFDYDLSPFELFEVD